MTPKPMTRTRTYKLASAVIALLAVGALTGCYERTVSTKGIGSETRSVEEPYAENWPFSAIEREVAADQQRTARPSRTKRAPAGGGGWD